jgi:hypothetical protein
LKSDQQKRAAEEALQVIFHFPILKEERKRME